MILRSAVHRVALAACALAACSPTPEQGLTGAAGETATPAITAAPFGRQDDTPVQLYTLTNKNGLIARILRSGQPYRHTMIHTFSTEP